MAVHCGCARPIKRFGCATRRLLLEGGVHRGLGGVALLKKRNNKISCGGPAIQETFEFCIKGVANRDGNDRYSRKIGKSDSTGKTGHV